MRKWMRERLKRRTKSTEESGGQSSPAPLQPAYFDSKAPDAESAETKVERKSAAEAHSERAPEAPQEGSSPEPASRSIRPASSRQRQSHAAIETSSPSVRLPGERLSSDRSPEKVSEQAFEERISEEKSLSSKSEKQEPQKPADDGRPRRRRRGRGGRGRSQGGASPQASVAADVQPALNQQSSGVEPHPSQELGATQSPVSGTRTAPHVSKGIVVLAIGLPGSGKSSWFKRHNISPLSSDLLRALLFDDPTEQRFQDLVFSNLRSMLKARLIARRPVNYVDATNLTPHERHGWIKLAKDYGYDVQAVFFDVPLEVCLQRNQKRERVVAENVMRRMSGKMKPPTFEEGFSKITMVRVKSKE